MQIDIRYSGSWRNSFLEDFNGKSNKGRKFIGSTTALKKPENYKERPISISTVMGLLYRLTGSVRPLYQLKKNDDSIISKLSDEGKISFSDQVINESKEIVFLRNSNDVKDQSGYSGLINDNIFNDLYLSGVFTPLKMNKEEIIDFLISNKIGIDISENKTHPLDIYYFLDKNNAAIFDKKNEHLVSYVKEKYGAEDNASLGKVIANETIEDFLKDAPDSCFSIISREEARKLNNLYSKYFESKLTLTSDAYLTAVNILTAQYLKEHGGESIHGFLSKSGSFKGISGNAKTFTAKDFLACFSKPKKVRGNPYSSKIYKKGESPIDVRLTKCDGLLSIFIDCNEETSAFLKEAIESAAVGTFYLGKKGLAYIEKIYEQ